MKKKGLRRRMILHQQNKKRRQCITVEGFEWLPNRNVTIVSSDEEGADTWDFLSYDPDEEEHGTYEQGQWIILGDPDDEWFTAYWYYPGDIDGTADELGEEERTVKFFIKVCLAGLDTGNEYQGAKFTLSGTFEAIQRSHEAAFEQWGVGFVDDEWVEVEYNVTTERWETESGSHYWDESAEPKVWDPIP